MVLPGVDATAAQEASLRALVARPVRHWGQGRAGIQEAYTRARSLSSAAVIEGELMRLDRDAGRLLQAMNPDIERWVDQYEAYQRNRWAAQVQASARIDIAPFMSADDVRPVLEAATRRSAGLIKGLSDEMEKKISTAVWDAYADGKGVSALARDLREAVDFAPSRARLIARDQTGTLSAEINRVRHEQADIERFEWSASMDDRTREDHADLNGKVFEYANPPSEGLPGFPINCRCVARPVLEPAED